MPAHVTVLVPFMPPERVTAAVLQQARTAVSAVCAFAFELSAVKRFPAAAYLAPVPAAPFIALTQSLVGSFPEYPPYGGQFQSVVPHLTVAHGSASRAGLAAAELQDTMRKHGPVSSYCSSVVLLENSSGLWTEMHAFALPRAMSGRGKLFAAYATTSRLADDHIEKGMNVASSRKHWAFSPHAGGSKIPPALQLETRLRIEQYAKDNYAGLYSRIQVTFRGALCYVDAFTEPTPPSPGLLRSLGESLDQYLARLREVPTRLCRLRYFAGLDHWSVALYSYSSERFEPCILPSGEYCGSAEECFALGASFYLIHQAA